MRVWFLRPTIVQTLTLILTYHHGMEWTRAAFAQVQQHFLTSVWIWISYFSVISIQNSLMLWQIKIIFFGVLRLSLYIIYLPHYISWKCYVIRMRLIVSILWNKCVFIKNWLIFFLSQGWQWMLVVKETFNLYLESIYSCSKNKNLGIKI